MCLFCHVSCTNSFLSSFINNSARGQGGWVGGTGAMGTAALEIMTGRGHRGTQEPCLLAVA